MWRLLQMYHLIKQSLEDRIQYLMLNNIPTYYLDKIFLFIFVFFSKFLLSLFPTFPLGLITMVRDLAEKKNKEKHLWDEANTKLPRL